MSVIPGFNSLCLRLPLKPQYSNNLCSTRLHVMIFVTFNIDIPAAPVHRRDSCKAKTPRLLTKELLNPKHLPLFFKINLIKFKSFGHLEVRFIISRSRIQCKMLLFRALWLFSFKKKKKKFLKNKMVQWEMK